MYIHCKDCASREQNHQARLNVMPRCRQSYAKIYFFSDTSKHLTDFKFYAPTDN